MFLCVLALTPRCGSVIDHRFLGTDRDFDFRHPGCATAALPSSDLLEVRYLGSGGAYLEWRGNAILLGPFFSNPGSLWRAALGRVAFDTKRISSGMKAVDCPSVCAIVTGHAHFDHIGDIPVLLRDYVPDAVVYTNDSGQRMLAPYEAKSRVVSVENHKRQWMDVPGSFGRPSGIRVMPLEWDHAPQLCGSDRAICNFARCDIKTTWTGPWTERRWKDLCGGHTFAFIIDFLNADGEPAFRIYYNDAAASKGVELPPHIGDDHPFDLAIICMASFDFVNGYPESLIAALQPRHIVVSHYEDFFLKSNGSWRFVPLMSNRKARTFMDRLTRAAAQIDTRPVPPVLASCGPATDRWSMPVPQSSIYFAVGERSGL